MSLIEFHRTTSRELLALTNKVRNLITHWGEDGRYKEAVLKNVISRFLPKNISLGSGFVIKQTDIRGEHITSNQIDLIIYDDSHPVLFREGDFIIVTPDAVRGIVEVKANLQNQGLTDVLRRSNENGHFIFAGKENKDRPFFNGIFSYEGYTNGLNARSIADSFENSNGDFEELEQYSQFKVNHVSLNKNWFFKYWEEEELPHSVYRINDLSFSFFISNLVSIVSNESVSKNSFIWFATDKELNLQYQF